MERTKIAVFLDTENLTKWIKNGGHETLLSELSGIGQIIVRRAYGKWTNQNLQPFQGELNRQGFELIHNYHPVSGKNSSDIQMTVDVMEYALRLNEVTWFVLATGDSDFSPLFRRLREMGKEVFGVGPRSPLSESVKTSCSKYVYTDATVSISKEVLRSTLDDAIDLTETALKAFDGPASCSALKVSITNLDSAFDEKLLGFKSFTDFLRSTESIQTTYDATNNTWYAYFSNSDAEISSMNISHNIEAEIKTEELYRKILRKKHWRSISGFRSWRTGIAFNFGGSCFGAGGSAGGRSGSWIFPCSASRCWRSTSARARASAFRRSRSASCAALARWIRPARSSIRPCSAADCRRPSSANCRASRSAAGRRAS
jgi:hypothetical protein